MLKIRRLKTIDLAETKSFLTDILSSMLFKHLSNVKFESLRIDGSKLTDVFYLVMKTVLAI